MSQMKDSYLLLRLLQANRQQLEKLLGRDWPAFLNLLESTLDSFLNGIPMRGSSKSIREIIEWVTRDAGERAADILRDVVKSVPTKQALPPGEIKVALPDSPKIVLTVPEDIPAGGVKRAEVVKEAEVMMRELGGTRSSAEIASPPALNSDTESQDTYSVTINSAAMGGHYYSHVSWDEATNAWHRIEETDPVRSGMGVRGEEVDPEEMPRRRGPSSRPDAPPFAPPAPEERRINVWLAERDEASRRPLCPQETYSLCFQFAQPRISSLVSGPQTEIPAADIPDAGLETEWAVTSSEVELLPSSSDVRVTAAGPSGPWTARFSLLIPSQGDSLVRTLKIRPLSNSARVSIAVSARFPSGLREHYRDLELTLEVGEGKRDTPVVQAEDEPISAARHLGLRSAREWIRPAGHLNIKVPPTGNLSVDGSYGAREIEDDIAPHWALPTISGSIKNVRDAAEGFRTRWEEYLNDIDGISLAAALRGYYAAPESDWSQLSNRADAAHQAAWDRVKASPELHNLAGAGHALYQDLFADDSLRGWVDKLPPGSRLNIVWKNTDVSNIPWGLMYRQAPPRPGGEVDPSAFLGLRYRISYSTHRVGDVSKALGAPDRIHQANFLYWGEQQNDITGVEARWQRDLWASRPRQILVPSPTAANRREELLNFWYQPSPAPIAVFYLFCQCKVGDGNAPVLSFGDALAPDLKRSDLRGTDLADHPLVFANACTTAAAEPYLANELEADFFRRGCRAFLGTETKVPIPLAARFASIFFDFFYRRVDPEPMAAGEALAQSRLFLWTRYRNIGGLFYTYINQYELFLADDAEVAALRA